MNIALSGAHRTGKSTLARAVAERMGLDLVPSRTVEAFRELGLTYSLSLHPNERLAVQELILQKHIEDVRRVSGRGWIADRSSLDMATYTLLAAATWGSVDSNPEATAWHERVADYVERCIEVANRHYDCVVLIQPGIPYVPEEGKPPPNPSEQEAFNCILFGLTQDPRLGCRTAFIRRHVTDLEDRVKSVINVGDTVTRLAYDEVLGYDGLLH